MHIYRLKKQGLHGSETYVNEALQKCIIEQHLSVNLLLV